jgi:hypothetical protein
MRTAVAPHPLDSAANKTQSARNARRRAQLTTINNNNALTVAINNNNNNNKQAQREAILLGAISAPCYPRRATASLQARPKIPCRL